MKRTPRPRPPVRMPSGLTGFRFPPEVILLAVRWYLRYGFPLRRVVVPAQSAVDDEVAPPAGPVLGMAGATFTLEARLCQRTLLSDVVRVGPRFEALDEGVVEQVVCECSLGGRAQPAAAILR